MDAIEALDKLAERISKIRKQYQNRYYHGPEQDSFNNGAGSGLYLALLEISDLKREIEAGEKPGN